MTVHQQRRNWRGARYYDTAGGDWIPSGKVIGRPFEVRHKEHQQCSLLKESKSSSILWGRHL
jgi:hypothetical protein